ncbi:hypothetical protein WR25_04663 isoform A [Diploscapter pachys]|uniref:HECT-type E3 ubiquitin transferase n=1 Tax=Diploscapter pachys TaxID=2018661 RepID=A0A2A2KHU3_9BILA|nr:hypothetical protein WR25_04663 isoform A [Diploscapter pachys]
MGVAHKEHHLSALDQHVAPGLRLWMLIALVGGVLLVMVVIVCCFMRIRIPRTKRQIELIAAKRKMRSERKNKKIAEQPQQHDERAQAIVMNSMRPAQSSSGHKSSHASSGSRGGHRHQGTDQQPLVHSHHKGGSKVHTEASGLGFTNGIKIAFSNSEKSSFMDPRSQIISAIIRRELKEFTDLNPGKSLKSNENILKWGLRMVAQAKLPEDLEVLCLLCRHIILSLDSPNKESNFASLFLNKASLPQASKLVSSLLSIAPQALDKITGSRVYEVQHILNGLLSKLNSTLYEEDNYRKLANSLFKACNDQKPLISVEALSAQFSIVLKLIREEDKLLNMFIVHVCTAPALIMHINQSTKDAFTSSKIYERILARLRKDESLIDDLNANLILYLLGNIIHMSYIEPQTTREHVLDFTWAVAALLGDCTQYVVKFSRKNHHHWHPIFGDSTIPIDRQTEGALKNVQMQLRLLWSAKIISCLFDKAFEGLNLNSDPGRTKKSSEPTKELSKTMEKLWKKLSKGIDGLSSSSAEEFKASEPTLTSVVAALFNTALITMPHTRSELNSALCRDDAILRQLWRYITSLPSIKGQSSSISSAVSFYSRCLPSVTHYSAPLQLFCDSAASLISILDEEELFQKGVPFSIGDLIDMCKFCNLFCFKAIWTGLIDDANINDNNLFTSVHNLCMALFARDTRRPFSADSKFWIPTDPKSSAIVAEFEKRTPKGLILMNRLSHVVPLKDRMVFFRKQVSAEKASLDGHPTLITVMRSRLLDDGYRQLAGLTTNALKATIRVKFINEQGLDEAGIDQDGVFKEFLELIVKKVFDPELNLFQSTSSGVLYPSLTSSLHEDHLQLFQFVGRMLGKAVYEGIVVDIQLAPVLLAAVLGGRRLCAFDELSQLDPELYRNLSFVKKYQGDVATDLSLTFSIDEDFLGKISTIDLIPGGRTIPVTNENRIDYVHRMAHHRVVVQTREQCRAFVQGVQSVLSASQLSIFSPHELQCLISGQSSDIDLADLKKHVQYYGGFHSGHRLIKWLWDIVENDFSAEERKLFLKFVTSCSRPPLLGFSYLEPPFSIRCVEVSDDQDQGDTLASVVRGFLALKKEKSALRLPTASTCFNLLKLPNYNKRSILLQKLRYAIR